MSRIILESSPVYLVLCLLLSLATAALLYRLKNPWGKGVNRLLFTFRAVLLFLLTLLLLGPIIKQVNNFFEKPILVLLQDDSESVQEVLDSTAYSEWERTLQQTKAALEDKAYEVEIRSLSVARSTSDFTRALKDVAADYESRKIAGVVLVSDGIYNAGISPLYSTFKFPIHTIGVGDTTQRTDLAIKNVSFNKIAYEGNKFPIVAVLQARGFASSEVEIDLFHRGKIVERKVVKIQNEDFTQVEFQPAATAQGIQRYEVVISPKSNEWNVENNKATVFVEVVAGKKKILAIASSPHPDVKVLRAVVDQNPNYEYTLYIPGVLEQDISKLHQEADVIILHQLPDAKGLNRVLFQQMLKTKAPLFLVLGEQSDWPELIKTNSVFLEAPPRQYDDVTPSLNKAFTLFTLPEEVATVFNSFPPASVPFAKENINPSAVPLLFQKVGSVVTDKPLLYIDNREERKMAVMMGEGMWRWRMHEYARYENTDMFDEVMGKLIQYLVTNDERRRFRSYPVQQQFSDTELIQLESQVYNDIFEPVYGNTIEIELTDESGSKNSFRYTTSAGNTRYTLGTLPQGVYTFRASTMLKEREEVRGEFLVVKQQLEMQNLTADFNLLRKLSAQTGGTFYKAEAFSELRNKLLEKEVKASIHTEEKYDPLINLKWIFFLLVVLISTEWILRKYYGGY